MLVTYATDTLSELGILNADGEDTSTIGDTHCFVESECCESGGKEQCCPCGVVTATPLKEGLQAQGEGGVETTGTMRPCRSLKEGVVKIVPARSSRLLTLVSTITGIGLIKEDDGGAGPLRAPDRIVEAQSWAAAKSATAGSAPDRIVEAQSWAAAKSATAGSAPDRIVEAQSWAAAKSATAGSAPDRIVEAQSWAAAKSATAGSAPDRIVEAQSWAAAKSATAGSAPDRIVEAQSWAAAKSATAGSAPDRIVEAQSWAAAKSATAGSAPDRIVEAQSWAAAKSATAGSAPDRIVEAQSWAAAKSATAGSAPDRIVEAQSWAAAKSATAGSAPDRIVEANRGPPLGLDIGKIDWMLVILHCAVAVKAGSARSLIDSLCRRVFNSLCAPLCGAFSKDFADRLAPQQFGVGIRGGCFTMANEIRFLLDSNPDWGAATIDSKNAFNCVEKRAAIHKALKEHFPHLLPFFDLTYGDCGYITVRMKRSPFDASIITESLLSAEGCQQGDPLGSFFFCLAIADILAACEVRFAVRVLAYVDDIIVLGPPEIVKSAFVWLRNELAGKNLIVQEKKCATFWATDHELLHDVKHSKLGFLAIKLPFGEATPIT